ncbi:aminoacyl-tRNA hydrolase [Candidatus Nomurabacteria bacterium]|nr:aminoacyl-tRNA hydrolase [Candidatus Nomurabacteria bacterium]
MSASKNNLIAVPQEEIAMRTVRSGGPGGQSVNKTASKVELRWSITDSNTFSPEQKNILLQNLKNRINSDGELVLHCESERSQKQNKALAYELLCTLVTKALHIPKKRITTKPSKASIKKREQNKKHQSLKKEHRKSPTLED